MRPEPEFVTRGGPGAATTAASPSSSQPNSPWQSPVPYLFGGLAAMLGLIAFALLILACSYWKISSYLDSESSDSGDQHDGGKSDDVSGNPSPTFFEEKILVIMAGDCKPTFLATPIASRAASLGAGAEGQEAKATDSNNTETSERDYDQSLNNSSHTHL